MNKLYRRCAVMAKRLIAEFEQNNLEVKTYLDVISYSVAYEYGTSFKTAERITKHVLGN